MTISSKVFCIRSYNNGRQCLAAGGLLIAAALAFAGCSVFPKPQADPTRYYVLNAALVQTPIDARAAGLRLGLHTVRSVPYLDGKAMIVRRGENEIAYRDFARWAEPLTVGVGRILNAQLLASGKVARIYQQPFPLDADRDFDVSLSILRCEGVVKPDGTAVTSLVCSVEITDAGANGAVRARRIFTATESSWREGDYSNLAALLSDAVTELAASVAADLPEKQ